MASSVYIVEPDIFTIMFEELRKKGGMKLVTVR